MDIKYKDTDGLEWIIPNVTAYRIVKTQARKRAQFAPVALLPKPNGTGGQSEWIQIDGLTMDLYRLLNPNLACQQWLWSHDHGESIAWIEKKEQVRVDKIWRKIPRRMKVPRFTLARVLSWPAIAIMLNIVYTVGEPVKGKGGEMYLEVVGMPADIDISTVTEEAYPGWVQACNSVSGKPVLRDGQNPKMILASRKGRKSPTKNGSLWIPVSTLEAL